MPLIMTFEMSLKKSFEIKKIKMSFEKSQITLKILFGLSFEMF